MLNTPFASSGGSD